MERDAYIALGSNLGDREAWLRAGLAGLERRGLPARACSSVWETEPVDAPGTPAFLNMVVRSRTGRSPRQVLRDLLAIEAEAGRRRAEPNAPRTLDLDLLLMGDLAIDDPDLSLPHPRMWQRRFVLAPLAQIAPDLRRPGTGLTVREELERLSTTPAVRRVPELAPARTLPV